MRWLNYHHLYYFWKVAQTGSISDACRDLKLSQPTVSAQLKNLEEMLGEPLFTRGARRLTLTETGVIAKKYADEIFGLGDEFLSLLEGTAERKDTSLTVGVVDHMPKYVSYRILEPILNQVGEVRLSVIEGTLEELLGGLAISNVDLILSDSPMPSDSKVKAFNHVLGQSEIAFVAAERLAKSLRKGFPNSLDGAPMVFPSAGSTMRRNVDRWIHEQDISPKSVGEFQDSGLMKLVASKGHGVVPIAAVVAEDLRRDYGLEVIGTTDAVVEKYYLISVERRIKHPAVRELCTSAPHLVFGEDR